MGPAEAYRQSLSHLPHLIIARFVTTAGQIGPRPKPRGSQTRIEAIQTRRDIIDRELQHDVGLSACRFPDVMHRDHRWALKTSKELRFGQEPFPNVGIERMVLSQHLHRYRRVESFIGRGIHRGKRPRPDRVPDQVVIDPSSGTINHNPSPAPRAHSDSAHSDSAAAISARPRLIRDFTVLTPTPSCSATSS